MMLINAEVVLKRLERFCKWCKDERLTGARFAIWLIKDEIRKDVFATFGVDILKEGLKGVKFTDEEEDDGGEDE